MANVDNVIVEEHLGDYIDYTDGAPRVAHLVRARRVEDTFRTPSYDGGVVETTVLSAPFITFVLLA